MPPARSQSRVGAGVPQAARRGGRTAGSPAKPRVPQVARPHAQIVRCVKFSRYGTRDVVK